MAKKPRRKTVVVSISVSKTTREALRRLARENKTSVTRILEDAFWATRQGELFSRGGAAAPLGGTSV